jgi:DNA polymerase-3 subunit gamma/tau
LLKTLEEPPSHVYFVFATTAPHKIPDTIKSRCQRHHFKRLEILEIADHLAKIGEAEDVKCEPEALRLLARKAEGSMRDAESLLDQCITAASGEVFTAKVRDILGILDQELVVELLRTVATRDSTEVLKRLDTAVHQGVDLEELLNALIEGFRDLMLLSSSPDLSELIFRSKDEIGLLQDILPFYELPDLVTIVGKLCNVAPRLKMASDPRILMESVLVDLSLLDRQTDIREMIDRLGGSGAPHPGGKKGTAARPARKPGARKGVITSETAESFVGGDGPSPQEPAAPESAGTARADGDSSAEDDGADADLGALDHTNLRKLWEGFVTFVRQKKVALGVCLISGALQSIDKRTVVLRFAKGFSYQKNQIEEAANKKYLKAMMSRYFGHDLELICFTEGEEAQAARKKHRLTTSGDKDTPGFPVESKPLVKKILTDFDGEIVSYHR